MAIFRLFCLIIFLLPALNVCGQDKSVTDSLRKDISRDSSISALLSLGREFFTIPDTAQKYLDAAKSRALMEGDSLQIAFSNLYLGMLAERNGDFDQAREFLSLSQSLSLPKSSSQLLAEQASEKAILLMRSGNLNEAISTLDDALTQPFAAPVENQIPLLLAGSMISYQHGDFSKSLQYGHVAESILNSSIASRTQAQIFNNIGTVYMHLGQPDVSACYLEQALEIRRKTGDRKGEATILNNLSILHNRTGNTLKAIETTRMVIDLTRQSGDSTLLAAGYQNMGIYSRKTGALDSALVYYDLSWQLFLRLDREANAAAALNSKALLLQDAGDYAGSLTMFFRALNMAREKNSADVAGLCHANIARLLQELGMVQEGRSHAASALKFLTNTKDQAFKGGLYREVGIFHLQEGQLGLADSCFQTAIRIAENTGNKTLEGEGWLGMSKVSLQKADYPLAFSQISRASEILEGTGNGKLSSQIWGVLGKSHWYLGHIPEAKKYIDQWAKEARENGQLLDYAEALEFQSIIYSEAGDFKRAFPASQRAAALKDSISGIAQSRTLASLQTLFNLREKQLTIHALEDDLMRSELERERNGLRAQRTQLFFIAGLLLFLLVAVILFYQLRRKMLARKAENLKLRLAASEQRSQFEEQLRAIQQQALQTRMNPHFTFNCLNSIQACILRQDQDSATLYLTQFSKLVRWAFEYSALDRITLEQEFDFLRLYCDLENLRFNNRVEVTFSIEGDIDPELALVPPMVIQPLVENAFQHGLTPHIQAPRIDISVSTDGDFQFWTIRDNGIGPTEPAESKFGVYRTPSGLARTRERLELLSKGTANLKNLLSIDRLIDENGQISGTQVTVLLPV